MFQDQIIDDLMRTGIYVRDRRGRTPNEDCKQYRNVETTNIGIKEQKGRG